MKRLVKNMTWGGIGIGFVIVAVVGLIILLGWAVGEQVSQTAQYCHDLHGVMENGKCVKL